MKAIVKVPIVISIGKNIIFIAPKKVFAWSLRGARREPLPFKPPEVPPKNTLVLEVPDISAMVRPSSIYLTFVFFLLFFLLIDFLNRASGMPRNARAHIPYIRELRACISLLRKDSACGNGNP